MRIKYKIVEDYYDIKHSGGEPDRGQVDYRTMEEEKCWKGYKKVGTKMKGGRRVNDCKKIKSESFATLDEDNSPVCEACLYETIIENKEILSEAKYRGRTVQLNKPTKGDVKKFKVFVKDPKTGNVKKVNFGDPNMRIKKSNPKRRKSFRARHHCENPGPKTKARYWSCKKW